MACNESATNELDFGFSDVTILGQLARVRQEPRDL